MTISRLSCSQFTSWWLQLHNQANELIAHLLFRVIVEVDRIYTCTNYTGCFPGWGGGVALPLLWPTSGSSALGVFLMMLLHIRVPGRGHRYGAFGLAGGSCGGWQRGQSRLFRPQRRSPGVTWDSQKGRATYPVAGASPKETKKVKWGTQMHYWAKTHPLITEIDNKLWGK